MTRWFRYYTEALDDPKVQLLSDALFRTWVNLLCLAARHGGVLPAIEDMAFALRLSEKETARRFDLLHSAELIDVTDGVISPHNWAARQFKTDVSNERVKQFRERHRNEPCNVTRSLHATPPENTDTDTYTEKIKENSLCSSKEKHKAADVDLPIAPSPARAPPKRAKARTPITDDALPERIDDAEGEKVGMTGNIFFIEWANFRNHHLAKGTLSADWRASWRTWCGNFQKFKHGTGPPKQRITNGFVAAMQEGFNGNHNSNHTAGAGAGSARSGIGAAPGVLPFRPRVDAGDSSLFDRGVKGADD